MKKQSISALLAQVMYLANEANEKTDKCVFVRLAGHVNWLEVSVAESKENYGHELFNEIIPLKHYNKSQLKDIASKLQNLIDNDEI